MNETNDLLTKILKALEENNNKITQLITIQQFQQNPTTNKFTDQYVQKEWSDTGSNSKKFGASNLTDSGRNSDIKKMIDDARNKAKSSIAQKMDLNLTKD